ncbi:MAG TPA: NAD(P)-dependent oxidoreductase [Conexibacter sp.]|nr:NAD(P)-dependent oxidoreductase [Conexibacter sp.]
MSGAASGRPDRRVGMSTRAAFLGLGTMGVPMARRLTAALDGSVAVWNRTAAKTAEVPDARPAATPAEAARDVDVIVTMVADGAALDALLEGPDGLLAGARAGSVLVDMSTIGPAAARAVAARCAEADVRFLDAPVSGSVPAATDGSLIAMVGGSAAALEQARPALAAMTRAQLHLGDHGAGAAMKLALNLQLAVVNQAIAETLVLAERSGIARADAYEVIASGALGAPYVHYKRAAFADPQQAPVAFAVDLMRKDVRLALSMAGDAGVELPAGAAAAVALERLAEAGLGAQDVSSALLGIVAPD